MNSDLRTYLEKYNRSPKETETETVRERCEQEGWDNEFNFTVPDTLGYERPKRKLCLGLKLRSRTNVKWTVGISSDVQGESSNAVVLNEYSVRFGFLRFFRTITDIEVRFQNIYNFSNRTEPNSSYYKTKPNQFFFS